MKNYNFATATRLDLEIWDTQEKIKYIHSLTKPIQVPPDGTIIGIYQTINRFLLL